MPAPDSLTNVEKRALLRMARDALEAAVLNRPQQFEQPGVSERLQCPGSCFVTLMVDDHLRGCIGGLEADQPLHADVRQRAGQAAVKDYRFVAVNRDELPRLVIEISVLSEPAQLSYNQPADLLRLLRPGIDGVILQHGQQRATFLPQVWERVSDPARFLGLLCDKLGLAPNAWRRERLQVFVYQAESFSEADFKAGSEVDHTSPFPSD